MSPCTAMTAQWRRRQDGDWPRFGRSHHWHDRVPLLYCVGGGGSRTMAAAVGDPHAFDWLFVVGLFGGLLAGIGGCMAHVTRAGARMAKYDLLR